MIFMNQKKSHELTIWKKEWLIIKPAERRYSYLSIITAPAMY
jgi:hypothetical protein